MKNYAVCTHANEPPKPPGFVERYCLHLRDTFGFMTVMDVGCGNGEYVEGFKNIGCYARGLDKFSDYDTVANIEVAARFIITPVDCVHSKSLIEHLRYPELAMENMVRMAEPDGMVVCLTPDIEYSHWSFWGDFGHVHPFNANSLYQLLDYAELKDIHVERFYKGPFDARWKKPLRGMLIGWGRK